MAFGWILTGIFVRALASRKKSEAWNFYNDKIWGGQFALASPLQILGAHPRDLRLWASLYNILSTYTKYDTVIVRFNIFIDADQRRLNKWCYDTIDSAVSLAIYCEYLSINQWTWHRRFGGACTRVLGTHYPCSRAVNTGILCTELSVKVKLILRVAIVSSDCRRRDTECLMLVLWSHACSGKYSTLVWILREKN